MEDFPDPNLSNAEGLVAIGGDLSEERLMKAYRSGIFPWYNPGEPILWWSPDPRLVLYPSELKISKSMQAFLKKAPFTYTMDKAFDQVIGLCSNIHRDAQDGTWITNEMIEAYKALYEKGYAHSVEVWQNEQLVGGLYGIALGKAFFGESMFHLVDNASKAGLIELTKWSINKGIGLIDCQVTSEHLKTLGAKEIPRTIFLEELENLVSKGDIDLWSLDH